MVDLYPYTLYLTVCVALLDLISETPAPLHAPKLLCDFHVRDTLLGVVQHKQHRLELHRLAAFAGCTHPPLHVHCFKLGHVGQSFDGGSAGARRAPLRRHHMGTGRAPGRSAFLLLRHLFYVIFRLQCTCRMHPTSMRRRRRVRGACSADVMRH